MKKIIYSFILLGIFTNGFAQLRISDKNKEEGGGNIHPRAILEIDSHKGIILPIANNLTEFPNYSPDEHDLFEDDDEMDGMLLFNKADKKLYLFDGENWIPSNAKSHRAENDISFLRSTHEDIIKINILNISTRDVVPFDQFYSIGTKVVNNANVIALDTDNDNYADSYEFVESGWYKINPSIMIKSGGGLSVGNIDAVVVLRASFVNDPDNSNYDTWWAVMQHDFSLQGLLVSVGGGNKAMNFEMVREFKAGDRIKFEVGLRNPDGLTVGSGITYMCSDPNTFLYIEKLD
jgi:hypothetical protein